jgi:hypothetical protein
MVHFSQLGTIIMSSLAEDQLNDIVKMIIDHYGSRLSGSELQEVIGIILENISGCEIADSRSLTEMINDIRNRYYESTNTAPSNS